MPWRDRSHSARTPDQRPPSQQLCTQPFRATENVERNLRCDPICGLLNRQDSFKILGSSFQKKKRWLLVAHHLWTSSHSRSFYSAQKTVSTLMVIFSYFVVLIQLTGNRNLERKSDCSDSNIWERWRQCLFSSRISEHGLFQRVPSHQRLRMEGPGQLLHCSCWWQRKRCTPETNKFQFASWTECCLGLPNAKRCCEKYWGLKSTYSFLLIPTGLCGVLERCCGWKTGQSSRQRISRGGCLLEFSSRAIYLEFCW